MFVVYGAAGVAGVDDAAHQPAGALMVVLPMEHAHVAGWRSYDGVVDGVACYLLVSSLFFR